MSAIFMADSMRFGPGCLEEAKGGGEWRRLLVLGGVESGGVVGDKDLEREAMG